MVVYAAIVLRRAPHLRRARPPARRRDLDDGGDGRGVSEPEPRGGRRGGGHRRLGTRACARCDPSAATEVLKPLVGGRDELLDNALMADASGPAARLGAAARCRRSKGRSTRAGLRPWSRSARDDGRARCSAGRDASGACHRAGLPDHRRDGERRGGARLVGASRSTRAGRSRSIPLPRGLRGDAHRRTRASWWRAASRPARYRRPADCGAGPATAVPTTCPPTVIRPASTASSASSATPSSSADRGWRASAFPPRSPRRARRRSSGATSAITIGVDAGGLPVSR